MLVRRNVAALDAERPWHPILLAYALAIQVMRARDPEDPTSWDYQAAVHDTFSPPPASERFRGQCQHFTWFFLPWHRAYLAYFEGMIRSVIAELPQVPEEVKDSWALPYWGYERGGDAAAIPPAFRVQSLPDGSPNPLFQPGRDPWMAAGALLPPEDITIARALAETQFSEPPVPRVPSGFGGSATGWHHSSGPGIPGELEATPHGSVHVTVGGDMSGFATAPLDAVFWLHHCNIDRLWTMWIAQGGGRRNPTASAWLRDVVFDFHDGSGAEVQTVPEDCGRPEDLGYVYDDITPPPDDPLRRRRSVPDRPARRSDIPPELVGGNEEPVELTGSPVTTTFPLDTPADVNSERRRRSDPEGPPVRVYLNVDDIEGQANPGLTYGVYLNTPAGAPDERADYHVGTLSFFGIETATDFDREHPEGHGLRYAFDVTDIVDALQAEGRWDPAGISVSFEPLRPILPEGVEPPELPPTPPVRIGTVSLFYQ